MEPVRTFIAIELPQPVKAILLRLQGDLRKSKSAPVKWVAPEGIHLTLKFLGNVDMSEMPKLNKALSEAVRGVTPIDLELGELGAFPNLNSPKVVWVGVAGDLRCLNTLHKNVECLLAPLGFAPEDRPFSPHLTLGRVRADSSAVERHRLGEAIAVLKMEEKPFFKADSVNLMRSVLTREGAVYNRLASFELGKH